MTISRTRLHRALLTLTAAALLTTSCGGGGDAPPATSSPSGAPASTAAPQLTDQQAPPARLLITVTIKNGAVTPTGEALQAAVGQPVVIRVDSDVADELFTNTDPEHAFPIEAKAGQQFQFTADEPGTIDVALRQLGGVIATITVP